MSSNSRASRALRSAKTAACAIAAAGVALSLMTVAAPAGNLPLASAACQLGSGSVMKPNYTAAFGVYNGGCGGPYGACVTAILYRNGAVAATGQRCGKGVLQVSTRWISVNPRDRLAATGRVDPQL